jgi:hypothetical protein
MEISVFEYFPKWLRLHIGPQKIRSTKSGLNLVEITWYFKKREHWRVIIGDSEHFRLLYTAVFYLELHIGMGGGKGRSWDVFSAWSIGVSPLVSGHRWGESQKSWAMTNLWDRGLSPWLLVIYFKVVYSGDCFYCICKIWWWIVKVWYSCHGRMLVAGDFISWNAADAMIFTGFLCHFFCFTVSPAVSWFVPAFFFTTIS